MDTPADLVSVAEAARRLDRSTEQVRRYLREGRLDGRRIGGQWFIDAVAIDAFRPARKAASGFLARIAAENPHDPLAEVIAIGSGGGGSGGDVAAGKDAYRRAFRWRRSER